MMKITLSACFLTIHMSFSPSLSAKVPEKSFFSQKQEEFLALNLPVYAYFSELYVSHKTPQQIATQYNLSDEISLTYLKALENIGLIKKEKENRLSGPIQFLVTGVSNFSAWGALSTRLTKLMMNDYHDKIMTLIDEKNSDIYLSSLGFWLTKEQYQKAREELKAFEEKYINLSVKNRKSKSFNAYRISAVFSLIPDWEPGVFYKIENHLEIKNN